jgi:hypothetical protein
MLADDVGEVLGHGITVVRPAFEGKVSWQGLKLLAWGAV